MSVLTRKTFIEGASAFALTFGRRMFAAPSGWIPPKKPNLVFGVLADTHLRISRDGGYDGKNWPDKYLVSALEYFRAQNVDAVVHCGDMADRGVIDEMQFHADAWRRVFKDDRSTDGRKVVKLFINGNHDVEGGGYGTGFRLEQIWPDPDELKKHLLSSDMAGNWLRIWGEPHEAVWHREVKGYHFFGCDWGRDETAFAEMIDANRGTCRLDEGTKPFFFITHDITHYAFNKFIGGCPNAFGLFGHWHQSAANWNTIRMLNETTPSIQCPAAYPFFGDGKWLGGGDKYISKAPLEGKLQGGQWRQGLVVRVYADMLVIERREFGEGGSLGADWVMPFEREEGKGKREEERIKKPHPFSKEALSEVIGEPQFRKGAKLEVVEEASASPCLRVRIPLADGNPDSRVYAYEVVVIGETGSKKLFKAVYAAGCNMGIGHEPNGGVTTLEIPTSELPPGEALTVAARPLTSLGTSGRPIATEFKV